MKKPQPEFWLTENEKRAINALAGRRVSTVSLAQELSLPRTTLDYILRKLHKRGFVKRVFVGKQVRWTREDQEMCFELYGDVLNKLYQSSDSLGLQKGGQVIPLSGVESLYAVYEEAVSPNHNHERRTQTMQSTQAAEEAFRKTQSMDIHAINKNFVTNDVVVEAVLPVQYYSELGAKLGNEWLKNFQGRASATTFTQDSMLTSPIDLWLFQGKIFLLNWFDENGLQIEHPAMFAMFQNFFTFMHASGRKVDQNAHIRELLKKYEK